MESQSRKVYLEVPYKEKDHAKRLGAFWDPEEKKWFVPNGKEVKPFKRWLKEGENSKEISR